MHDPAALQGSPLVRSRLVREHGGGTSVLATLLTDAATAMQADPRGAELFAVLDRTFLRPAPTQERAAELLHLSFSTYRRHRDRAVARVVDRLWHDEVYGSAENDHQMDTERPGT